MLSSPPPRFAACDERLRGRVEVAAVLLEQLVRSSRRRPSRRGRRSRSGRRRPARAATGKLSTSTSGSVPSARVITERCGWVSASSGESSPRRTSSATSEWSSVSCSSAPVAQPVGARVADVAEEDAAVRLDERDGDRRAHPRGGRVLVRALPDARGSPPGSARRRAPRRRRRRRRCPPGARRRRAARRPRPPARRPSRRRRRRAAARRRTRPRCGAACGRGRSCRRARTTSSVAPRSGGRSRRRGRRRPAAGGARARAGSPLTKVPLVEPTSST